MKGFCGNFANTLFIIPLSDLDDSDVVIVFGHHEIGMYCDGLALHNLFEFGLFTERRNTGRDM